MIDYKTLLARRDARIKEIEDGIKKFLSGDYANPRHYRPTGCPHDVNYWQDCQQCDDSYFEKLLEGGE